MNFICETVTIVESNIMFDANVSCALGLSKLVIDAIFDSIQIEVHFHSQIYIFLSEYLCTLYCIIGLSASLVSPI